MIERVLVCGLGSMGKRRIRLLKHQYPKLEIVGIDSSNERCKEAEEKFYIHTVDIDFEKVVQSWQPNAVFVCTPPLSHADIVIYCLENSIDTFSEINLSAKRYKTILALVEEKNKIAFLSSTCLYKKEMNWIIKRVQMETQLSYRYHVGQYLPDWHPWENWKNFFVSEKATSALREIMSIEFPWIIKAFGNVVDYKILTGMSSTLELDYQDTCHLLIRHENGITGNVTFDCASIKAVRKLEIFSDKLYIEWNGTFDTLGIYLTDQRRMQSIKLYHHVDKDDAYEDFIIDDPYLKEMKIFFEMIKNNCGVAVYGYEDDLKVLELIDDIAVAI